MNIPDEVIDEAAKAYFLASEEEMGFTESTWSGATEDTWRQFRWAAFQMVPDVAEWARREALKEAVEAIANTDSGPQDFWGLETAADVVRALISKNDTHE